MKKRLLPFGFIAFLLIISFGTKGQNLFSPVDIPESQIPKEIKNARHIQFLLLNEGMVKTILNQNPARLSFSIPIEGGNSLSWMLDKKPDPLAGVQIRTSGNQIFDKPIPPALHFGSSEKGGFNSLSILPQGIWGIFSFGKGNFNLVPTQLKQGKSTIYALYNDLDLIQKPPFQCLVKDDENHSVLPKPTPPGDKGASSPEACKKIRFFLECDHQTYLDNGQSVANTANWISAMFQVVGSLYFNEGIPLKISEIFIHTQPDQYPTSSSFDALDAFGDTLTVRPPQNTDLSHLLSTKNNSLGGVAYLDVLCNDFANYAYSNIYNAFAPLPIYSWTVNVVAHEIGHNVGSPHTQSCSWPLPGGSLGMLDSCYTPEGGCYGGPPIPTMGTIMSYCHLIMGVDLSKGFGPLPGNLLRDRFDAAICLQGNVVFPPMTISKPDTVCEGSTTTLSVTEVSGAGYVWTGPAGFSSTDREPMINISNAGQAGLYQVVVSRDGCESMPLKTQVRLDCLPFQTDGDRSLCPGQVVPVVFRTHFFPGPGNQFQAELSDANGSFQNPTLLGTLASENQSGQFSAIIPTNLAPGIGYFIRLKSTNPVQTGQATGPFSMGVAGSSATISGVSRCGPGTLTFSGPTGFSIRWFSDSLSGVPLATGSSFQTPGLSQNTFFWFESQSKTKASAGPSNTNFTSNGGQLSNLTHGLYFRVDQDLVIDSVSLRAQGFGEVVFRVRDSANTKTFAQVTRMVSGNLSFEKIAIDIRLTPGTYRVDAIGSSVVSLHRNSDVTQFPFDTPGWMSITHSTAANRYYWFYDWKISGLSCPGGRQKVLAQVLPLPPTPLTTADSVCREGTCVLQASGAIGNQTYQWFSASGNAIPGATQPQFATPLLNTSTQYRVSIRSGPNCESSKVVVLAIVNPKGPTLTPQNGQGCMGQTINLSAAPTGPISGWQWLLGNGTAIPGATTNQFSITATVPDTNFLVFGYSPKGCPGDTISVAASGIALPGPASGADSSRCGPGALTLKAEGAQAGEHYHWYVTENGLLADTIPGGQTGTLTLSNQTATQVFFVAIAGNGHCESATRKPLAAIISEPPAIPVLSQNDHWLISSIDTLIQWYKNGVFLVAQGDSLDLSIYGDGAYQAIIIRANGCTSVSETYITNRIAIDIQTIPVQIRPNPFEEKFWISTPMDGIKTLVLKDVLGRQVSNQSFSEQEYLFSCQDLPSGIYFVKVSAGEKQSDWFKLMKK